MLNAKTLSRLVILTVICAVPVVVISFKDGISSIKHKTTLFMPDLLKNPEEITKVILQDRKHTITLLLENKVWYMQERNKYPVLKDKVEELLYSLADLRVVEPKTANHEYYKQLDVNDVNDVDSNSLLITLQRADNSDVAKLYIGKREGVRLGEEYQEHIFVRRANEDQTWLVQGVIPLSNDFRDWVEQPLLGIIDSDQIKSLEIDQNQSKKIFISKAKQEQEDFVLENFQAKNGMVLDLDTVNSVPFEIAELEFTDVQPAATTIIDWDNRLTATLDTFPGVRVVLNIVKQGDKILARVHANAMPEAKEELQLKVLSFNNNKRDWVYELSPEIYKAISLSGADFLKAAD